MNRDAAIQTLFSEPGPWDMVVVGGGATGVGVAVDAASRGYKVLLVEQHDFGKGTSSRSTKLVHGGVRYLAQGNLSLVREALRERGLLRRNAPHLVHDRSFVVPSYSWWERPYYGLGLKAYALMAGRRSFGATRLLSKAETTRRVPTARQAGLRGGVVYHDGQFDDARLLINLVATAVEQGAVLANYVRAVELLKSAGGQVGGVAVEDVESGRQTEVTARVVINAAGAFCDDVRKMADAGAPGLIAPSQGIHLVFRREFLPGDDALLVPRTPDGRVMFAIPWHGRTLVGTTDTPLNAASLEPRATEAETEFVLETAGRYLDPAPTRADVRAVFAGVRPLVKSGGKSNTAALSRDHTIQIDRAGLVTVTGGKWTTYRNMAEDCVNQAMARTGLPLRNCVTRTLPIHGSQPTSLPPLPPGEGRGEGAIEKGLAIYGADAAKIAALAASDASLGQLLHADLPYIAAEVVWAARHEMARTVEDVLARRTRALFLDADAAVAMAPRVAQLLARELGRDAAWQAKQVRDFNALAAGYVLA